MVNRLFCSILIISAVLVNSAFAGTYSGGTGEPNSPYLIADVNDLLEMRDEPNDWAGHFLLVNDINLAGLVFERAVIAYSISSSFDGTAFDGVFDGNDHRITNLTIDTAGAGNDYLGLFGKTDSNSQVINLDMEDVNISAGIKSSFIGGICGLNVGGAISDCNAVLNISNFSNVGGICGRNEGGTIFNCNSSGNIQGSHGLGGICGYNGYSSINGIYGTISNCNSTVNIQGDVGLSTELGGLCGYNSGDISNCYATGSVSSSRDYSMLIGGLCGSGSNISNCYSTGSVSSSGDYSRLIGGLCGSGSNISNCYSTGTVSGGDDSTYLGGLCGRGDSISNCYSTGTVSGGDNSDYIGGLCGEGDTISKSYSVGEVHLDNPYYSNGQRRNYGGLCGSGDSYDITDCYYLITSGPDNSGYNYDLGIPLTNTEMKEQSSFEEWDFVGESVNGPNDYWDIVAGRYPKLSWQDDDGPQQPQEKYYSGGLGCEEQPFKISCVNDLLFMGEKPWHMSSHFLLTNDIDLADLDIDPETPGKQELTEALISSRGYFSGVFDGNNYSIRNLTINANDSSGLLGLFDVISGKIMNLGVEDVNITGSQSSNYIGGLCGENYNGLISNCYTTGVIIQNFGGGSYPFYTGGLCGLNFGITPYLGVSTITNCYSTVDITSGGFDRVGGLCAYNAGGLISNSYATGSVTGNESYSLGGLCGGNATGWDYYSTIINCYASGSVTGGDDSILIGGLCGDNSAIISNSYSTGSVTSGNSSASLGGFCGGNSWGTISDCYFLNTAGPDNGNGRGTPLTDSQLKQQVNFAGWDFIGESVNGPNDVWAICEGDNYPKLTWKIPIAADFLCPDGVDFIDYSYFVDQWMLEVVAEDVTSDGIVNFQDWAVMAGDSENINDYQQVRLISQNWLKESADKADIAPAGGDKIVDWEDLAEFCELWLEGIE